MKVFIGWSGEPSKIVAEALREWIPKVIQVVRPWMSKHDILPGARWSSELNAQLEQTHFGIAVMTRENLEAPWIHFEAGAVAKRVGESSVCPYLLDVESESELTGPLTQFQARKADKDGTLDLLRAINVTLGEKKLADDTLTDTFERFWADLEDRLKNLPSSEAPAPPRAERDILEEILERVRSLGRGTAQARLFPALADPSQVPLWTELLKGDTKSDSFVKLLAQVVSNDPWKKAKDDNNEGEK